MTQDEIIRFAIQCRLVTTGNRDGLYMDALTEFANLVAAKALAQPEQEPVEWPHKYGCRANAFGKCNMGCTTPPQRTWVGLTDEERQDIALEVPMDAVLITEAKLKEKNT